MLRLRLTDTMLVDAPDKTLADFETARQSNALFEVGDGTHLNPNAVLYVWEIEKTEE